MLGSIHGKRKPPPRERSGDGIVDIGRQECQRKDVKSTNPTAEPRTPGTMAVENHRPLMNKLSPAERRRLRQRAAELLSEP